MAPKIFQEKAPTPWEPQIQNTVWSSPRCTAKSLKLCSLLPFQDILGSRSDTELPEVVFSTRWCLAPGFPYPSCFLPAQSLNSISDSPTTRQDPACPHWQGNTNSHAKSYLQHCCLQKIQEKKKNPNLHTSASHTHRGIRWGVAAEHSSPTQPQPLLEGQSLRQPWKPLSCPRDEPSDTLEPGAPAVVTDSLTGMQQANNYTLERYIIYFGVVQAWVLVVFHKSSISTIKTF